MKTDSRMGIRFSLAALLGLEPRTPNEVRTDSCSCILYKLGTVDVCGARKIYRLGATKFFDRCTFPPLTVSRTASARAETNHLSHAQLEGN